MTKKKTIFFLGLSGISEEPMFYLDNLTMHILTICKEKRSQKLSQMPLSAKLMA